MKGYNYNEKLVSVPIRGLFNLTICISAYDTYFYSLRVSVPIRGLFNLTYYEYFKTYQPNRTKRFRPHQGII